MDKQDQGMAADLGLFVLRTTFGGLLAGHGAQKLFGLFGGHGIEGTAGWLESTGMKPGKPWAIMAGAGEFGSGMLTALGLLGPLGPISTYGPMITAWAQVHAGKPIWNTSGGAELPLLYLSAATALALTGPGRFSLDKALGIKVPAPLVGLAVAGVAAGVAASLMMREPQAQQEGDTGEQEQAGEESEQGAEASDSRPAISATIDVPASRIGQAVGTQDEGMTREVGGDQSSSFGGADTNAGATEPTL